MSPFVIRHHPLYPAVTRCRSSSPVVTRCDPSSTVAIRCDPWSTVVIPFPPTPPPSPPPFLEKTLITGKIENYQFGDFIQEDLTLQHWYLLALENAKKKNLGLSHHPRKGKGPVVVKRWINIGAYLPAKPRKKCARYAQLPGTHQKITKKYLASQGFPHVPRFRDVPPCKTSKKMCQICQVARHFKAFPTLSCLCCQWTCGGGAFLTTAGTGQIYI